ncbi:ECF-type sigma factor [Pirellulaceae bacterium]|nr:ECF-type sigma factor [Pirellulaceae bacterium]
MQKSQLTQLIREAVNGDKSSQDEAAIVVYDELKKTAEWLMKSEANVTIQPTALVNQVIVKLFQTEKISELPNRAYFFGAAARSMRRILLDEARRRKAIKRGGDMIRRPFDELLDRYEKKGIDVVSLNEAMDKLENIHQRQADVVHMKWFLEMTTTQISDELEVSVTTVENDWRTAKAFLYAQLNDT